MISLKNVVVSSVSSSGSAGSDRMIEEVTLHFSRIKVEYWTIDDKGGRTAGPSFEWNIPLEKESF